MEFAFVTHQESGVLKYVLFVSLFFPLAVNAEHASSRPGERPAATGDHAPSRLSYNFGVRFTCEKSKLENIKTEMTKLFERFEWSSETFQIVATREGRSLDFQLNLEPEQTDTLNIASRPELKIKDEGLRFKEIDGSETVTTNVSDAQIVASLMNPGRLTEFKGEACSFEDFLNHVATRKAIAASGRMANMRFSGATRTQFNSKYWETETQRYFKLKEGADLTEALQDALLNRREYDMGCTIATNIISAAGIMNYYKNIKKDEGKATELAQKLGSKIFDTIEPSWTTGPSPILERQTGVAPRNWIPGDWGYIRNTDKVSAEAAYGDEGKNIIFIGNGTFSKYYLRARPVTLEFNLKQVYQWRFDASNRAPFDPEWDALILTLEKDPSDGGLLRHVRDVPRISK